MTKETDEAWCATLPENRFPQCIKVTGARVVGSLIPLACPHPIAPTSCPASLTDAGDLKCESFTVSDPSSSGNAWLLADFKRSAL